MEVSDHRHRGQILTYAGGTDPTHVVWVARFRLEHRVALEWLNERTDERSRFFAVQLEVVRIGASPPAPLLKLVVQPNDWEKHMRASTTASGRTWRAEDFFAALSEVGNEVVTAAARRLYDHIRQTGRRASAYWGEGRRPSLTAQVPVGSVTLQPWVFYVERAAGGGPVFAVNFEWITRMDEELVTKP